MHNLFRFLLVLAFVSPTVLFANEPQEEEVLATEADHESPKSETEAISEFVVHHTFDSYEFHFFTIGDSHYGFSLPIILWDNGLQVFSSSHFHHGEAVAESNGNFYKIEHNKIYKTDAAGTITYDEHRQPTNAKPMDFSITKNVFSTLFIAMLMFWIFRSVAKSYRTNLAPSGAAKFIEPLILFVRDEIAIPNIGEKQHKKYMIYLLTVFFFIWFLNLFGMTPLGINVTGNIAVTFTLAIMTFIITQATSKPDYWKHIFWMPGVPVPMKILLAPIELLGVFIKPFALMIRLYANMLAGHIVLGSLIGLIFLFPNWGAKGAFLGLTFFLNIIELLVAFLQAYIFTMLTALYFGAASAEHEHH
ncbi:MAG: F0F1 ATP synthase subunit A [Crocinitomicaceae bacterium]|jgi:F-type H+-transporting ATPase subunit a